MVILISGASHTGKTVLAQRILEKYHFPYLSLDHLKMGLIRGGYTELTPSDGEALTAYLWPLVREMVKTAIENHQNLVVEGCYIPLGWAEDFSDEYRSCIRHCCLVMTEEYVRRHFSSVLAHASDLEDRGDESDLSVEWLVEQNARNLELCRAHGCGFALIDHDYGQAADSAMEMLTSGL